MTKYARCNSDGTVVEIIETDQSPADLYHPEIAATIRPADADVTYGWSWSAEAWCAPAVDLDAIRLRAIAGLRSACGAAITGGFMSSALGGSHRYPSTTVDQINLMGSVTASLLPGLDPTWTTPFWCADASGAWAYRDHTADQIQAVGRDGKAWVVTCQRRLEDLTTSVSSTATESEISAIVWPEA